MSSLTSNFNNLLFLETVVQLEINPFFQQKELVQNLTSKGIAIQAYSPLASGLKLSDSRLVSIAKSYDSTTAQLLIQWCIQKEYSCITKSRNKKHLEDNINLGEFFIGDDDMKVKCACHQRCSQGGKRAVASPNDEKLGVGETLKFAIKSIHWEVALK